MCIAVLQKYCSTKLHKRKKNMTQTTTVNTTCILQSNDKEQSNASYEATIMDAIDESLATFGKTAKQATYYQLETTFHIKKNEIPFKIRAFADAIEKLFGPGARLIEMKIIEALHEKFQDFTYIPQKKELVFAEYVENLLRFLPLSA